MATTITVVCPHCSNRMRASSDYIGRRGRCPSCKQLVQITAPGDDESLVTTHPVSTARSDEQVTRGPRVTDVPTWLTGLIGMAAAVALYIGLFLPLRNVRFGQMFLDRGITPYFITLMSCWGFAILVMKYTMVKRQLSYAELELELIPLDIGLQITPANVDQFLGHLGRLPANQRFSILGRRIQGALEHFKSRHNVPEVQSYLTTQAEIDASGVDSGYTLLKAFIWAVPILGFIGTVLGLSKAVSGLELVSAQSGDIAVNLTSAMGNVTAGLSTAFDTTLIALVMAIALLFPVESLRKVEYGTLDRIEQFANQSLLRRMADERESPADQQLPEIVRHALERAFQEHQRWLAQWQAQVGELGQVIGGDFEQVLDRVLNRLSEADAEKQQQLSELARSLSGIFDNMVAATASWRQAEQHLSSRTDELVRAVRDMEDSLSDTGKLSRDLLEKQNQFWEEHRSRDLGSYMKGLGDQIERLAGRLDDGAAPEEDPLKGTPTFRSVDQRGDNLPVTQKKTKRRHFFGRWR